MHVLGIGLRLSGLVAVPLPPDELLCISLAVFLTFPHVDHLATAKLVFSFSACVSYKSHRALACAVLSWLGSWLFPVSPILLAW